MFLFSYPAQPSSETRRDETLGAKQENGYKCIANQYPYAQKVRGHIKVPNFPSGGQWLEQHTKSKIRD
ncbi:hypothetical protein EYC84_004782 [Monilinia fructicola]|uniref:Uncharacterized protein n=1 Tax=Monilinia fructicola TaxID=38448 RepID=A0A5M9K9U3_MONFR|nr:hypothetical protein EYC84_004782 [Monilinia fructicola]